MTKFSMDIRNSRKFGAEVRNLRTPTTFELHKRSIFHFKGVFKGNNFYLEHFPQIHLSGHYNSPPRGWETRGESIASRPEILMGSDMNN